MIPAPIRKSEVQRPFAVVELRLYMRFRPTVFPSRAEECISAALIVHCFAADWDRLY
jgi:hypothetical protein